MPDDDARKRSGERFAADLRTKREERGLAAEELCERLRVPSGLFEAFESGRLVGHPMFNRVYLRSLARSYADATGTPSAPVLSALGATLNGEYEKGQLQREIEAYDESVEEEGEAAAAAEREASPTEDSAGAESHAESDEATPPSEPDWMTSSPPGASTEAAEQRDREREEQAREREREREERARQQEQRREERAAQQQETRRERAARQSAAAEQSTAAQQERREERPARHRRRQRSSGSNAGRWGAGLLVLALVAAGLYFLVPVLSGDGGGAETAQTAAAPADTAAGGAQEAQQRDRPPRADLQLGETVSFTLVAEEGPVRDLKVTRDQDVRRPYWIEEGQATVFPTQQRIIIENPPAGEPTLQNARLLIEGYPYPTDRRDAQGRLVITREDLQAFADTLRGEPAQIPAQRDTAAFLGGGSPQGGNEEGAAPQI
jgi:hypothetical protein